jgi:demethylmenaquinone methyltransferase/2-methoxy-6-polyprenyl-1,4-benzoquinol methylase
MNDQVSPSEPRTPDTDETDAYARRMETLDALRARAMGAAIEALCRPEGPISTGSRGLDVGCGIGLQALLLARAAGHVTGLDREPAFLARARAAAGRAGLADRCTFRQGDLRALPYDDGTFDWLWCADALWPGPEELGYPVQDPVPVVREFARVVRPGGIVALVYWSAQKLLPGHPLLEARLSATSVPVAPFREGMPPEAHMLRALGWLRAAGLSACTARTFVAQVQAPLGDALRDALAAAMDMFWGQAEPEVSAEDWARFQRLCRPDSAECVLHLPDYCGFITYTLFYGEVG